MLTKLKALLQNSLPIEFVDSEDLHATSKLAAAALMIEVMVADYAEHPAEKTLLTQLLQKEFLLSATEAENLLNEALAAHAEATDYFHFTRDINRHYSPQQKINLIEMLWKMAYADKEIAAVEQHVIRRIASLLHVPHPEFIAAKVRVTGD